MAPFSWPRFGRKKTAKNETKYVGETDSEVPPARVPTLELLDTVTTKRAEGEVEREQRSAEKPGKKLRRASLASAQPPPPPPGPAIQDPYAGPRQGLNHHPSSFHSLGYAAPPHPDAYNMSNGASFMPPVASGSTTTTTTHRRFRRRTVSGPSPSASPPIHGQMTALEEDSERRDSDPIRRMKQDIQISTYLLNKLKLRDHRRGAGASAPQGADSMPHRSNINIPPGGPSYGYGYGYGAGSGGGYASPPLPGVPPYDPARVVDRRNLVAPHLNAWAHGSESHMVHNHGMLFHPYPPAPPYPSTSASASANVNVNVGGAQGQGQRWRGQAVQVVPAYLQPPAGSLAAPVGRTHRRRASEAAPLPSAGLDGTARVEHWVNEHSHQQSHRRVRRASDFAETATRGSGKENEGPAYAVSVGRGKPQRPEHQQPPTAAPAPLLVEENPTTLWGNFRNTNATTGIAHTTPSRPPTVLPDAPAPILIQPSRSASPKPSKHLSLSSETGRTTATKDSARKRSSRHSSSTRTVGHTGGGGGSGGAAHIALVPETITVLDSTAGSSGPTPDATSIVVNPADDSGVDLGNDYYYGDSLNGARSAAPQPHIHGAKKKEEKKKSKKEDGERDEEREERRRSRRKRSKAEENLSHSNFADGAPYEELGGHLRVRIASDVPLATSGDATKSRKVRFRAKESVIGTPPAAREAFEVHLPSSGAGQTRLYARGR